MKREADFQPLVFFIYFGLFVQTHKMGVCRFLHIAFYKRHNLTVVKMKRPKQENQAGLLLAGLKLYLFDQTDGNTKKPLEEQGVC
jgi:hypothetical protein